jgi:glycosyltransferase involved in cell wall biosynthesis
LRILLIGNYEPDKQQSMLRFLAIMSKELKNLGFNIHSIQPSPFFGKINFGPKLLKKWLGYIDRYILFPFVLLKIRHHYDIFHILDHSNSLYINYLETKKCIITFHDAIGIKSANGEIKEFRGTLTGKLYHKWILNGLKKAKRIVSVSQFSENELLELIEKKIQGQIKFKIIHNGLNYPYSPQGKEKKSDVNFSIKKSYLIHVGTNHERKNREGVMKVFAELKKKWDGLLVFVGPELSPDLLNLAKNLGIYEQIKIVSDPDNSFLEDLYNNAYALLFPSLYEGFGWPVIEAQACGCPVVCSNRGPLPEITNGSALMSDVENIDDFAQNLLKLQDKDFREKIIAKGLENVKRFSSQEMAKKYGEVYLEVFKS